MAEATAVAEPEAEAAEAGAGTATDANPGVSDEDVKDFAFFEQLRREAPDDSAITPAEPAAEAESEGEDAPEDAGKKQPEAEAKEEAPNKEEEQKPEAKTEEQKPAEPEGFDDALAALLRDQIPRSRLEEWFESDPDGFVAHGLKRKSVQANQDRFGQESNKNRDDLEKMKASQQKAEPEAAYEQAPAQPAAEPQMQAPIGVDVVTAIDEALAPLINEDNAELFFDVKDPIKQAIVTLGQSVSARLTGQFQQENQALRNQVDDMGYAIVNFQIQTARDKLVASGQYPKAEDDEWFENEAMSRYDTISESKNRPATVHDAVEEAIKWASADLTVDDLKTSILSRSRGRKNGQPRAQTATRLSEPITDDAKEELEFMKLRRKHGMVEN